MIMNSDLAQIGNGEITAQGMRKGEQRLTNKLKAQHYEETD